MAACQRRPPSSSVQISDWQSRCVWSGDQCGRDQLGSFVWGCWGITRAFFCRSALSASAERTLFEFANSLCRLPRCHASDVRLFAPSHSSPQQQPHFSLFRRPPFLTVSCPFSCHRLSIFHFVLFPSVISNLASAVCHFDRPTSPDHHRPARRQHRLLYFLLQHYRRQIYTTYLTFPPPVAMSPYRLSAIPPSLLMSS